MSVEEIVQYVKNSKFHSNTEVIPLDKLLKSLGDTSKKERILDKSKHLKELFSDLIYKNYDQIGLKMDQKEMQEKKKITSNLMSQYHKSKHTRKAKINIVQAPKEKDDLEESIFGVQNANLNLNEVTVSRDFKSHFQEKLQVKSRFFQ